jgi:hypothetical protein
MASIILLKSAGDVLDTANQISLDKSHDVKKSRDSAQLIRERATEANEVKIRV